MDYFLSNPNILRVRGYVEFAYTSLAWSNTKGHRACYRFDKYRTYL